MGRVGVWDGAGVGRAGDATAAVGSTWKFFSDCFSFLSEIGKQSSLFHLLNVLSRLENDALHPGAPEPAGKQ